MTYMMHRHCHSGLGGEGDTYNDVSSEHFVVTASVYRSQNTAATTKTNVANGEHHPNQEMLKWEE